MPDVFAIEGLRKHIFAYLRKRPYCACDSCSRVVQWNQCGKMLVSTMSYGGITECSDCFKERELFESSYASFFN